MVARHGFRSPSHIFNASISPVTMSGVIEGKVMCQMAEDLITPEVKTNINFAVFVKDPAEKHAESGENEGPGDGKGVVFDHEAWDDIAGAKKNGGV